MEQPAPTIWQTRLVAIGHALDTADEPMADLAIVAVGDRIRVSGLRFHSSIRHSGWVPFWVVLDGDRLVPMAVGAATEGS